MVRSALHCPEAFCDVSVMHVHNTLQSVCLSVSPHSVSLQNGWVDRDVVGDGGWVGLCIGVLDFGSDRRRGRNSFGRGKFGTFHWNQWDCLREGRWRGSSEITLGFACYMHCR